MIGAKIKERRLELGLTQKQLGEKSGIGKGTICNYETGISEPDENNILAIANALECDINYLFSDYFTTTTETLSISEQAMIEKYRKLDAHGRRMVDYVVNEEFVRCDQPPNTE